MGRRTFQLFNCGDYHNLLSSASNDFGCGEIGEHSVLVSRRPRIQLQASTDFWARPRRIGNGLGERAGQEEKWREKGRNGNPDSGNTVTYRLMRMRRSRSVCNRVRVAKRKQRGKRDRKCEPTGAGFFALSILVVVAKILYVPFNGRVSTRNVFVMAFFFHFYVQRTSTRVCPGTADTCVFPGLTEGHQLNVRIRQKLCKYTSSTTRL